MASRQNELHVDDLLNSFETTNKGTKDNKAKKPDTNDWDDQEEDGFALGIGRTQQAAKTKTKKKTTAKGWGDVDAGSAPQQPTVDFATLQDKEGEKKKKIFNKPNGTTKAVANVVVDEEYFPSLGEERSRQAPKKAEPAPVVQSTPSTASSSGPKRFMNAKKQGAGESFAPLEPVQEKALPVVTEKPVERVEKVEKVEKSEPAVQQQRAPGFGFQRRTVEEQPKEAAAPADTKFKFGGEGPRKFVGNNKISFKREEEKSELERAREEKEREVEEKLAREREELAKQRENREFKKGPKTDEKTETTEKAESPKENTEQPTEEKRIAKFSNSKKVAEKAKTDVVVEQKVEEVVDETKPTVPVESVEMHGSLSNKGWGDGPLKKSQKK